jgi:hypothetical protein
MTKRPRPNRNHCTNFDPCVYNAKQRKGIFCPFIDEKETRKEIKMTENAKEILEKFTKEEIILYLLDDGHILFDKYLHSKLLGAKWRIHNQKLRQISDKSTVELSNITNITNPIENRRRFVLWNEQEKEVRRMLRENQALFDSIDKQRQKEGNNESKNS